MIEEIKAKVRELLNSKKANVVVGYKRSQDGVSAMPAFIYKEKDADKLIWDAYCVHNLSAYLKEFSGKKVGIIAKECDIRSIVVLLQENQVKREDVAIIGVECSGVIDDEKTRLAKEAAGELSFDEKCRKCKPSIPSFYDFLISKTDIKDRDQDTEEDTYENVRKLEVKSIQDKFKFWNEEFSRCIRCYACRQICPLCYCPTCVADQSELPWFSAAFSPKGNFSWNVTRAMHLAGRCIDCGECERACPVAIPLRDINNKIEKDVKELFNYESGVNAEQKPLLSSFDKNDPDDFIR